ncbi:MAG TPA: energy-coupling factor transporter transmembrane protein EcfT [Humibacillus xanthopallidus]|nr:energy-coupling factor transporter transmembrane protein EcfT [Humibacillus xanthopallidus]
MREPGLFSAHVVGDSWLHRAPFGVKLIGVIAVGLLPWWVHSAVPLAAVLAALLLIAVTAGVPLARLLRSLRSLAPVLVLLGAFQWWAVGPAYAVRVVLGIATAFVAAGLLTATTPVTTMLDAVVRGARPASRWVDPEVVALTLAVVLRSVPWVAGAFAVVRESARARGLERDPRALVVPTVVQVVAYGRATGEALAARGLTDPAERA